MSTIESILDENIINVESLAKLVRASGRSILSVESDHIWVEGNQYTNIQVGHIANKKSVGVIAGRPLPNDMGETACSLLANRLNAEFDVVRFYARFSEIGRRHILFIDHYVFYEEKLITSHFLMSMQFVEFFALEFDIKRFEPDRPIPN